MSRLISSRSTIVADSNSSSTSTTNMMNMDGREESMDNDGDYNGTIGVKTMIFDGVFHNNGVDGAGASQRDDDQVMDNEMEGYNEDDDEKHHDDENNAESDDSVDDTMNNNENLKMETSTRILRTRIGRIVRLGLEDSHQTVR